MKFYHHCSGNTHNSWQFCTAVTEECPGVKSWQVGYYNIAATLFKGMIHPSSEKLKSVNIVASIRSNKSVQVQTSSEQNDFFSLLIDCM